MNEWRYLRDDGSGAAAGLALDEALMSGFSRTSEPAPPVLRLYTYRSHAALCGRYQHLEAELDLQACRRSGTAFNRRPTGGGAIVMGEGQLGVAVVTRAPAGESPKALLLRFSEGIVAGLDRLGIEATFGGKNDLKVDGKKIAGLGLFLDGRGGLLFHASVLADLDVPFMLEVLDIPAAKLGAAAVAAVEERVMTVSRATGRPWTGAALADIVADGFARALDLNLTPSEPSDEERRRAAELVTEKYGSDEWLFQRTPHPDATGTALLKTPSGLVRLYVAMSGSTMKSAMFAGDFNTLPDALVRLEDSLKWSRSEPEAILENVNTSCPEGCGLGVDNAAIADLVVEAAGKAMRMEQASPTRQGSCYFPETDQGRRKVTT